MTFNERCPSTGDNLRETSPPSAWVAAMSTMQKVNWQERAAFQWSTAGNDVVATVIARLFFSVFLRRDLFS